MFTQLTWCVGQETPFVAGFTTPPLWKTIFSLFYSVSAHLYYDHYHIHFRYLHRILILFILSFSYYKTLKLHLTFMIKKCLKTWCSNATIAMIKVMNVLQWMLLWNLATRNRKREIRSIRSWRLQFYIAQWIFLRILLWKIFKTSVMPKNSQPQILKKTIFTANYHKNVIWFFALRLIALLAFSSLLTE